MKQDNLSATCDFLGFDTASARWTADDRPPRRVNTPDGGGRARTERLTSLTPCLSLQTAAKREESRAGGEGEPIGGIISVHQKSV